MPNDSQNEISHAICSISSTSGPLFCVDCHLPYRMPCLTVGKCVSCFLTCPSVVWPDSSIGNTTCTANRGVSRVLNYYY